MNDRMFEIVLFTTGIIGLFLLFTTLYVGPRFILNQIIGAFGG